MNESKDSKAPETQTSGKQPLEDSELKQIAGGSGHPRPADPIDDENPTVEFSAVGVGGPSGPVTSSGS